MVRMAALEAMAPMLVMLVVLEVMAEVMWLLMTSLRLHQPSLQVVVIAGAALLFLRAGRFLT
jgi:hypothetical protein